MSMENRGIGLSQTRSQSVLRKYHQLTSPLVSLQTAKRQDLLKEEIRQNVTMRLDCIKNRGSKIYALNTSITFPQLKAAATLYQIPEFSAPEVNFEVSEQIRRKVDEARREIISSLPQISKSSNYAPRKIEHQLNQRTAVRQLEQWLGQKLRSPPTNAEQSIQYKNMIMGVGMKELIRLIGKRCAEQGRMTEQIWELTWSICREIILYLSKRAKKCEQLLEEELQFMRTSYEKEFQRLTNENNRISAQHQTFKEEHAQLQAEAARLRKRRQSLESQNKSLGFDNQHLQQEFKKVLEQNLAIYLQISDKSKRGWIRKIYKNISALSEDTESTIKNIFKKQVIEVVQDRNKLEEVTGDCQEVIDAEQIQEIGDGVVHKSAAKKNRSRQQNKMRNLKQVCQTRNYQSANEDKTMITEAKCDQAASEAESEVSEPSCAELISHMRQQFLPIDAEVQTDAKKLIDAQASTIPQEFTQKQTNVDPTCLGCLQEMGVNTEQPKQEAKLGKKKGKQNTKEQPRKEKSKIFNVPPLREKSKPKGDTKEKEKKPALDVVQEINMHHEDSRVSEKEESVSAVNQQIITEIIPSNSDLGMLDGKAFQKKNSLFAFTDPPEPTIKTNSAIYTPAFALQVKQKLIDHILPQKQEKEDVIKQIQQTISPKPSLTVRAIDKQENLSILCDQREKQVHSISCGGGINRFKEDDVRVSLNECSVYICAQCNKIINSLEESYQYPKNRFSQLEKSSIQQEKRSARASPTGSIKGLSAIQDQNDEETMGERRSIGMKRGRRQNRKNSSYIHDIAFKKDLEEQQQGQQTPFKSTFPNYSKDETYEIQELGEEVYQQPTTVYNKMAPHVLFFSQILEDNKSFVQTIVNAPQQQAQNLQHYFQLVRQINALPDAKTMTEKSAISIIEKTIFPILSQLLGVVKKAAKSSRISEMMRVFTSLPSIVYTRITRKYGVKILAIKNLKVLLMALRQAGRFTDKYKIIQLMMFTDCKSPHSEDLFMYLFAMALFDPSFSATRVLALEDTRTLRTICEDYLSHDASLYGEFEKLGNEGALLTNLLKGVVTSYRLLKINRIEEVGFVYLMLKKDHHMTYKKFICFLTALALPHHTKLAIAKKMLQFCDIRVKDRIAISEIMFSKFLINCQEFSYKLLEDAVNRQLQGYRCADLEKDIVNHLSSQFFKTQNYIRIKFDLQDQKDKILLEPQCPRDSIAVEQQESIISGEAEQRSQKVNESVTVVPQIKQYSSFTYHVCKYLQNEQETKYLTQKQHLFVKNYLIVYIVQAEIEKTMGLVDYFSNSMLHVLKTPQHQTVLK